MKKIPTFFGVLLALVVLQACKSSSKTKSPSAIKGEYIYRHHEEELFAVEPLRKVERDRYPWELENPSQWPKLTKEYFRCKGNLLNPVKIVQKGIEPQYYYDCGGVQRHSLPIREGKEFIFPILIDLVNYIQLKTGEKVIITSGHCCAEHNTYLDASVANQASKHQLGAEVDFYVEEMQDQPEKIIELIQAYYQETPKYNNAKEFITFERFMNIDKTNVRVPPWYNKEIFVKLVQSTEGRDTDNDHAYPYITIQVRYDWDLKETVTYSWNKVYRGFYRR